jgi:hypothetical protein
MSLAAWRDDIALAAAELSSTTQARKLVVVGLRLGATLAALTTTSGMLRPRHLLLWDPVVDGSVYLRELGALHRAVQEPRGAAATASSNGCPTEVLGTPISAALAAELEAIDLAAAPPACEHLTVLTTGESAAVERLRPLAGAPGSRWLDVPPGNMPWSSASAFNASVVPSEALQAVVNRIVEVSP